MKRWFIPAAARARGQSNDLNREILASNLFNCHKEVINTPPVPSISRCIHIVYRHKNVWEYQWSNFIYNCMSTFLHYVHCKDALLDCSAPGGERCESLTWVDEIAKISSNAVMRCCLLVGIAIGLWAYVIVGGFIFTALESSHEDETINGTLDVYLDLLREYINYHKWIKMYLKWHGSTTTLDNKSLPLTHWDRMTHICVSKFG